MTSADRLEIASAPRIEPVSDTPGLYVVRLAPEFEAERALPEWINALEAGSWLQLSLPDADPRRLCVGWTGGTPRLLLAADPDSDFTILFPQRWLQARAVDKAATPLLPDGVFERAAEAAIARYH